MSKRDTVLLMDKQTLHKYYNKISNIVLDRAVDLVLTGRVDSRTNWLHV